MIEALFALLILTLVKATPLIYAALGGVIGERAGVINIALEGMLAIGAFCAVAVSYATGSPLLAALAGIAAGAALGLLLGIAATRWRVDQIVAGTGLNLIAVGGAAYSLVLVFGRPGASPAVHALGRTGEVVLIAGAFAAALALSAVLRTTPWGLRLRTAGENPTVLRERRYRSAAHPSASPHRRRRARGRRRRLSLARRARSLLHRHDRRTRLHRACSSDLRALDASSSGATGAALFFGFFAALQFTLQRSGVPSEVMQALPYLAALAALAGFAGRARAPRADGIPYTRQ